MADIAAKVSVLLSVSGSPEPKPLRGCSYEGGLGLRSGDTFFAAASGPTLSSLISGGSADQESVTEHLAL